MKIVYVLALRISDCVTGHGFGRRFKPVQGVYAKDIAGLLGLCSESIYKELVSIGKRHLDALVQHSRAVTDHIE